MFNLSLISKYRTELMGVAMLMVVWHHLPIDINLSSYKFLHLNAVLGVDIFLLLSGIGLYFSTYNKGFKIKEYLIKRFIRIFPIYAFIILVVSIIKGNHDLLNILCQITTIGWWIGKGTYDWFIPNIILLYLLYPFWYYILKYKRGIYIGGSIILILYTIIFNLPQGYHFISLYRYPIFFIGIILGKILKEKRYNKNINIIILFFFTIGVIFSVYIFKNYYQPNISPELVSKGYLFSPYIFIVVGLCLTISYFLSFNNIFNATNLLLKWIGSMSIEIYLIHGQFIDLTKYLTNTYHINKPLTGTILVSFSFGIAYLVHLLNIKIMDLLKSKLLR